MRVSLFEEDIVVVMADGEGVVDGSIGNDVMAGRMYVCMYAGARRLRKASLISPAIIIIVMLKSES